MADIKLIVKTIDEHLEKNHLERVSAVEAASVLAKKGILADSAARPGLPLRNILRDGEIEHAIYEIKKGKKRGHWFIPHS